MKNFLLQTAALLSIPVLLFNYFSGLVALIWMAILGKWLLIGAGIVSIFVSHFIIGLAMIPAVGLQAIGFAFAKKRIKILAILFLYLGTILNMAVISFWVAFVYFFGLSNVSSTNELLPVMIGAYSVSIGPILFMASKETDNLGTIYMTYFISLGCFLNTILISFFNYDLLSAMIIFLILMSVCLNIMFYDAWSKI